MKTITSILAELTKLLVSLKEIQTELPKLGIEHTDTITASKTLLEMAIDEIEVENDERMDDYRNGLS